MIKKIIKTRTGKCPHCKESTTHNLEAEILKFYYVEFWRCRNCLESNRGTGTIEQLYCTTTQFPDLVFEERKTFHASQDVSDNNVVDVSAEVNSEVSSLPEVSSKTEAVFVCTHKYNCSAHEKICRKIHGIIKPQGGNCVI